MIEKFSIVDDIGSILVDWDNGSTLGVAYGEDHCRKLTQEELEEEELSDTDFEMRMWGGN